MKGYAMSGQEFVIVGGGLAAASAAEAMRNEGFDGTIRLVGAETHHPYIRPPLSKEFVKGDAELDTVFVHKDDWYLENQIDLMLGRRVNELDVGAHEVELDDGKRLHYDRVLLATGASSRHLSVEGSDASGIYYLRTIEDSQALRSQIEQGGKRIVVVGSGWIGLEVTAAARGYGNDVTVIGMDPVPLSAVLGDELGGVFGELHRQNGVSLHLPAGIRSFNVDNGRVTAVVTENETLPADLVVVGVGAVPNIELAQRASLTIDNGILTNERMQTNAPDVFAAGDVANAFHPVVQRHMRNEHWANALNGGAAAGKSMLGQDSVFSDIPYFYTDQYDLGMEYSGYPPLTSAAQVVYRGNLETREFVSFWHVDGRVVAGMNVNIWDVNEDVQALIRSGKRVDLDRLTDSDIPIAEV